MFPAVRETKTVSLALLTAHSKPGRQATSGKAAAAAFWEPSGTPIPQHQEVEFPCLPLLLSWKDACQTLVSPNYTAGKGGKKNHTN